MKDNYAAAANPVDIADTIIALGASAGGLEALDHFLGAIDPDLPAAYVVIQHLAPGHQTMLGSLLARHTRMKVKDAAEGDRLRAGHVYVMPPGVMMTLRDMRLHLTPRPALGMVHPVNTFFHSLAHSGCDQIFGIVLSGSNPDGSEGLRSIAEAGGWVLAQSPASAAFDGMPRNAMATGLVHRDETPEGLAALVQDIVREGRRPPPPMANDSTVPGIDQTLWRIGGHVGVDLASYKPQTMARRLERRVLATGHPEIGSYLDQLDDNPAEVARLRRELLIPVTAFFRDRDAFDVLTQKVIRPLLLHRLAAGEKPHLRIWSVGCSTGQEAYSLAIAGFEAMRELGITAELKVFATDIEPSYLAVGAAGHYPERLLQDLPQALRERYFVSVGDGECKVVSRLRQAIVFSRHDVLHDPPFLNIDLVVCRNMIIYLQPAPQERALRRMMFGLAPGGALFLGSSEEPGRHGSMLEPVCRRSRIWRSRGQLRHLASADILSAATGKTWPGASCEDPRAHSPLASPATEPLPEPAPAQVPRHVIAAPEPVFGMLLSAYVPPSIVIDETREIRQVHGDVFPYLNTREGDPSLDLLQLLPGRMATVAGMLISSVLREGGGTKSVVMNPADDPAFRVEASPEGGDAPVRIVVRGVPQRGTDGRRRLIISFEPVELVPAVPPAIAPAAPRHEGAGGRLAQRPDDGAAALRAELEQVRAILKTMTRELSRENDALQASNEELMAANEELQGTNEELQAVNEELHTVNAELQENLLQLNEAYADLEGLSQAARIPLIFLDGTGRVLRFSRQATEVFRLCELDIGRPLLDISHALDMPDLESRITAAMSSDQVQRREVAGLDGRSWLVTIQPCIDRSREGTRIVVSFIDISSVQALRYLQSVIDAAPQNLAVLDRRGNIRMVNAAWSRFASDNGGTNALANGHEVNYLGALREAARQDREAERVLSGLEELLDGQRERFSFIYPCHSPSRRRWFMMHAAALFQGGCVVTHMDITDLKLPEDAEPEREGVD